MRRHVLFILSSFNIGGAEIDVLNLSRELIKKEYRVTIASQGGELEKELPEAVNHLSMDIPSRNQWVSFLNKLKLFFYCLFHSVSIINPQSLKGVLGAAIAAKVLGIPMIATIHNLHNGKYLKQAVRLLNRVPDVTLFVSEYERQKFLDAGLKPEHSGVMYSGINLKRYLPEFEQPEKPVIGMIGRLSAEKGSIYGIEAFSMIHREFPEAKLMIVGDGPERKNLEKAVHEQRLEDKVEFLGARNDVPEIMSKMSFLILPSLTESLSVVAREAMATGKPVISSDVGGMAELIEHQTNGLLVPATDTDRLASAMRELLGDPSKVEKYGKEARQKIERHFSINVWSQKMELFYQKALGEQESFSSQKRNRVLYITTRFPFPTTKGDKLRAYYQIREMSKHNDVYLLTLLEDPSDRKYFSELAPYCKEIIPIELSRKRSARNRFLAHFSWIPSQIGYFYSPELKEKLPGIILAKNIDTVYCQLIRAGQYAAKLTNVRKVIDFVDAFSLNLKRNLEQAPITKKPIIWFRMLKTRWFEQKMLKAFDHALIISEADKKALNHSDLLVLPNGVVQEKLPQAKSSESEKSVIFTGNMDYWPNEDAARYLVEEIMPHLSPDIKVYLTGINNNPRVKRYANGRVIVTGKVPSMIQAIRNATVAVCPMRLGAGQQNKVLEAMSAGVPVVLTDIANAGVGARECVKIGNSPESLAKAINELIEKPSERQLLREKASLFIQRKFDWSRIMWKLQVNLKNGLPGRSAFAASVRNSSALRESRSVLRPISNRSIRTMK